MYMVKLTLSVSAPSETSELPQLAYQLKYPYLNYYQLFSFSPRIRLMVSLSVYKI